MRYLKVTPKGEVIDSEQDALDAATIEAATGGRFRAVEPDGSMVVFINNDPLTAPDYNWLATQLVRRRLHPSDHVNGGAIVTGPVDVQGHPTDVTDEVLARVNGMAQR